MPSLFPQKQKDNWSRMVRENHLFWNVIKGNIPKNRYNDFGRFAALAYEITGEESYAVTALAAWKPYAVAEHNNLRENVIEWAMLRQLLKPHLEKVGRLAEVDGYLKAMAETILAGCRLGDSDEATVFLFGLAMTDAVLGTAYMTKSVRDGLGGPLVPVGGLTVTTDGARTLRNTVNHFVVKMAGQGGNWFESTMYDINTTSLMYMGWSFLATWHGVDYFPEVAAFIDEHRRQILHQITPNLKDSFQSGDAQQPGIIREVDYTTILATLGYLPTAEANEGAAAAVRGLEAELRATNAGWSIAVGTSPAYARYFYFADPWAPIDPAWREWRGVAMHSNQGHVYTRNRADTSALHFHHATYTYGEVDHMGAFPFGDLQWTDKTGWLLKHPLAYGPDTRLANQSIIVNRQGSHESSELVGFTHQPDDYTYMSGMSAGYGPDITPNYYDPPPPYIHEQRRSVFVLDDDVVIVQDRIHASDPAAQTMKDGKTKAITRYYPAAQTRMAAKKGLKSVIWHTPVAPTFPSGAVMTWPARADVTMRIEQVLPRELLRVEVVDENLDTTLSGNFQPNQKAFATYFSSDRAFDSIVWGITRNQAAVFTPIQVGVLEGVQVDRPGKMPVVVLFSAKVGPMVTATKSSTGTAAYDRRKIDAVKTATEVSEATTVTVEPGTRVLIAHLAPAGTESPNAAVTVNGQPVNALGVVGDVTIPIPEPEPEPEPVSEARAILSEVRTLLEKLETVLD